MTEGIQNKRSFTLKELVTYCLFAVTLTFEATLIYGRFNAQEIEHDADDKAIHARVGVLEERLEKKIKVIYENKREIIYLKTELELVEFRLRGCEGE